MMIDTIHNDSRFTVKTMVTDIAKYAVHGVVITTAIAGLDAYFTIMFLNLEYGNRIPFVPFLLILCVPFVFMLLGALNRTITEQFWNYKSTNNWAGLLVHGVILMLVNMLIVGIFVNLLMDFFHIYSGGFLAVLFFIPYNLVIIPFIGLVCKLVLKVIMDISKAIG